MAPGVEFFNHFRDLAQDILFGSAVREAYNLEKEEPRLRDLYGRHIGGQSILLARRLTEAGVPIVTVVCAAGDLNGDGIINALDLVIFKKLFGKPCL
jgi:hypothetical protein